MDAMWELFIANNNATICLYQTIGMKENPLFVFYITFIACKRGAPQRLHVDIQYFILTFIL